MLASCYLPVTVCLCYLSTALSSPQVENGEGLNKEETKVEEP